jgi:hypothetical protein
MIGSAAVISPFCNAGPAVGGVVRQAVRLKQTKLAAKKQ